ncbi:MAG: hypothetical protein K0U59_09865 [Gammaproteobacteria bacterium]|nr:hypothetical protein [Gammaproteobacteria bacterium]
MLLGFLHLVVGLGPVPRGDGWPSTVYRVVVSSLTPESYNIRSVLHEYSLVVVSSLTPESYNPPVVTL